MKMKTFQEYVAGWMRLCFAPEVIQDTRERNFRFLEEALELAQAGGCTVEQARKLVTYVFRRPVGVKEQEVGGVMVTLAAWCGAHGVDLESAARREYWRIMNPEVMQKIQDKQKSKRDLMGPLP